MPAHDPNHEHTLDTPRGPVEAGPDDRTQTRPSEPAARAQPDGSPLVAGYELAGEIARGGMGVVYRARDASLDREVAVKVMLPGMDAAQFVRESRITARLPHPGIPPVHALGTLADGRPFLAMKLIRGETLDRLLRARTDPAADRPQLLAAFEQMCQAVGYAHAQGIVHRDLKPANVMVGAFGEVQVMDWGLAKAVGAAESEATVPDGGAFSEDIAATVAGQVKGTPAYMAPEQARGEAVDARADVFALGGILAAILTGRPPFVGNSVLDTIIRAAGAELNDVFDRLDGCGADDELADLVKHCLAPRAADRPGSGEEVAAAVAAYRAGVDARLRRAERDRAVTAAEAREQRKRRRVQVLMAGAVAAVALVGALASTAAALYAHRQRRAAEAAEAQESTRARREAEAKQEAVAARQQEAAARRGAQRQLVELSAASGLLAARQGEDDRALLWFARSIALSGGTPDDDRLNRVRHANWTRRMLRPVGVFESPDFRLTPGAFTAFDPHPDGRYLLLLSAGGPAVIRDLEGASSRRLPADRPAAVAWGPDGKRVAVAASESVEVYSFPSLERVQTVPLPSEVKVIAFSPDGRHLAAAEATTVRVWDLKAEAFVTPPLHHPREVIGVRFSGRGERLATGCADDRARVFAVPSEGDAPVFPAVPHRAHSRTDDPPPSFAGLDKVLLTATGEGAVVIRSVADGRVLHTLSPPRGAYTVTALVPHPDGRRAALVWDYGVRLWDVSAGRELGTAASPQLIASAAIDPAGTVLVTAGADTTARFWSADPRRPAEPVAYPLRHPAQLLRACYTRRGLLLTAQLDGRVVSWARPDGDPVAYRVPTGGATRLAGSPDGGHFAPAGMSQLRAGTLCETRVYDATTGRPAGPQMDVGGVLTAAAFSPDGTTLATGCSTGSDPAARERVMWTAAGGARGVQLWDWRAGARRRDPIPTPTELRGLAFSADGKLLAAACADGWVAIIDPAAGRVLHRLDSGSRSRPYLPNLWITNGEARFGPDGRLLATWEMDGAVHLWNATAGRKLFTLAHDDRAWDVAFDPGGRWLVVGTDTKAHVWDLKTGRPAGPPLPHPQPVTTVRFTDGGDRLMTGCGDGIVRRWDWRAEKLLAGDRHHPAIQDVALSADGRWIISATNEATGLFDRRTGAPAAPPLLREMTGIGVHLTRDGTRAVVAGFGGTAVGLDLSALTAPAVGRPADLTREAELLSCSRIEDAGNVVQLSSEEWAERWRWFRARGEAGRPAGK